MIIWNPAGQLDISTDASDLPQTTDEQRNIVSNALRRSKNMHTDRAGKTITRYGSQKINSSAIDTDIRLIVEQGGTRYTFTGDQIYQDESSIVSSLTEADWSAVKYNAYNDTTQQIYALNGIDRKRIEGSSVYEWGIAAPTDTPVATNTTGTLSGDYSAKVTYVGKVGTTVVRESDPGPVSNTVTTATNGLQVQVTRPTDTQITDLRFYRTTTGGALYYEDSDYTLRSLNDTYNYTYDWEETGTYIAGTGDKLTTTSGNYEITFSWEADTTTETFVYSALEMWTFEPIVQVLTKADGSLDSLVETDHDRPPLGTYVLGPVYNGYLFIVKDNLMYWCDAKEPEYWNPVNFIEVSSIQNPGILMVLYNGQPYFLTKNEIYYIQGTGDGTFFPLPMKAKTGAQGIQGAYAISGHGIYHTGPDGVYLFSNGNDVKVTHRTLEPIFRGESVEGLPAVSDITTSWLFVADDKLYFGYTSSGYTYPTNVIVYNLTTNLSCYYNYNDNELRTIAYDSENQRILVGDDSGFIWEIENDTLTDDGGTAISWEVQSKDFTLPTRKHFPRWVKYDLDASSATSVVGTVLLDGASHQTHTITGNRNTVRRLVDTGNGNREAIKITGSGACTIHTVEAE